MSDQDGFFGDIFDSPNDDPLLQSDDPSAAAEQSDQQEFGSSEPRTSESASAREQSPNNQSFSTEDEVPSWMNDDDFMSEGAADGGDLNEQVPAEKQQVVVAPRPEGEMRGLATLNEAFDHGWRLQNIGVSDESDLPQPAFVVTIERDIPRSLFDFGGPR